MYISWYYSIAWNYYQANTEKILNPPDLRVSKKRNVL